jgi:serine/threonine protein kinase
MIHRAATLHFISINNMEVLTTGECFPHNPSEPIFTIVVYSQDDATYLARYNGRCGSKTDIPLEELKDVVKLDKTAFQPLYLEKFTQAQPSDQHYVKRPSLLRYYPISDANKISIMDEVLQEVQVCEVLKLQHHPNIAKYIGCEAQDGRISGICFKQYKQSLLQRLNPGHLNKRMFATSACLDAKWCSGIIEGIRKGIEHLHTLGLVHNDLTPANVMLDERDSAIIIDFGSCRRIGESLKGAGRTYEWYEWYDDDVQITRPSDDLDALAEIEAWLLGKVDDFKFIEKAARS